MQRTLFESFAPEGASGGTGSPSAATSSPAPSAPSAPASSAPSAGGSQTTSSGPSSGSSSPQQPSASAGTPPAGAPAPAGGTLGQQQTQLSPFRQLATQYAPDLTQQHADDQALFQALLQQRQVAAQQMQYAQQMLPYWSQFQGWRAQQEAQGRMQQGGGQDAWWSKYWSPPEYDPSWEHLLRRDEQGNLVPINGAPPDLPGRYLQYQQYRREQLDRFLQNPFTFFEEPVKQLAQQIADQAVQQHMSGYRDNQFAHDFVRQNESWLYARDAQGNVVQESNFDPNQGRVVSRPALSQLGQAFQGYVNESIQLGIQDVRAQQRYALSMVQRDAAVAGRGQANGAAAANDAARQNFLQTAAGQNHVPNHGGSQSSPNFNGNTPPQNASLGLAELMRRNLAQGGVTDRDLQAVR